MKSTKSRILLIGVGVVAFTAAIILLTRHFKKEFLIPKIEDEPELVKVMQEPFTELIPGYGVVVHSGPELQIEVGIDAADSRNVRVGQNVSVRFRQLQNKLVGKVTRLLRYAGSETNQSICWITAKNPDGKEHSGEFVWAEVEWVSGNPVLVIPSAALFVKEKKTWVVTADKKPKEIKIGRTNDEKVEVLEGVAPEDSVMTAGAIGYLYPDFKAGGED